MLYFPYWMVVIYMDAKKRELLLEMCPMITARVMEDADLKGAAPSEVAIKYAEAFELVYTVLESMVKSADS